MISKSTYVNLICTTRILEVEKMGDELPSNFEDLGISVFIISDPEVRPSKILELLKSRAIKFQRISPFFFKQYPTDFDARRSRVLSKKHLTLSEVGCAKSHLTCYEIFLKSESDFALIFEDDADLINSNVDALWDITEKYILFTNEVSKLEPIALTYHTESANLITANKDFYSAVGNASNTMAYLINRLGASELIVRNAHLDYVADWPRGTRIKFHVPVTKLFDHGSKNGSVKSLIESGRILYRRGFILNLLQNLSIVTFTTYFRNLSYFSNFKDYIRVLWFPIIQWKYFRIASKPIPNSNNHLYLRKSKNTR